MSLVSNLVSKVEQLVGYTFKNRELLAEALTHKSYSIEKAELSASTSLTPYFERLEFLGDAVLDLAITELLIREFPNDQEGPLTQKRAALVCEESLAAQSLLLGLDQILLLGRGERKTSIDKKPRLLANAMESILGALFIEAGYLPCLQFIEKIFIEKMRSLLNEDDYRQDFKTRLQEEIQKTIKQTPNYIVENEQGPPHDRTFEMTVRLEDKILGHGTGKSKKQAEQLAAKEALEGKTYENEKQ
jgi:ribonuclease-3